ncbi:MAG: hypothetical protein EON54_00970 [Alcaligenaceae bacterium]|nr:MAG: hypothetical protein EON54_00970 [Alcaligenaceae bacterium]
MNLKPILGKTTVTSVGVFLPYPVAKDGDTGAFMENLVKKGKKISSFWSSPTLKGHPKPDPYLFHVAMRMGDEASLHLDCSRNGQRGMELYFEDFAKNWDYGMEVLMGDLSQLLGKHLHSMLDYAKLSHICMRARVRGCKKSDVIALEEQASGSFRLVKRAPKQSRTRLSFPDGVEISGRSPYRDFPEIWIDYCSSNPGNARNFVEENPFSKIKLFAKKSIASVDVGSTEGAAHSHQERCAAINATLRAMTTEESQHWLATNQLDGWNADLVWDDVVGYLSAYLLPNLHRPV